MRAGGGGDASAVPALLSEDPARGLGGGHDPRAPLAAPHLVMFEAANVLRRWMTSGRLPQEVVALAHDDLLALPLELWPYAPLAEQVPLTGAWRTAPAIRCFVLTPP